MGLHSIGCIYTSLCHKICLFADLSSLEFLVTNYFLGNLSEESLPDAANKIALFANGRILFLGLDLRRTIV